MPVAGGGFEQSYNAQAAVDTETMLMVATGLTQAANDKQQVAPMMTALFALLLRMDIRGKAGAGRQRELTRLNELVRLASSSEGLGLGVGGAVVRTLE